jgi:hypothetical protein
MPLFGIRSIVSDKSWQLEANYTLSPQLVFIGLFAYLLIEKGLMHLLTHGSAVSGPLSVPS